MSHKYSIQKGNCYNTIGLRKGGGGLIQIIQYTWYKVKETWL